MNSQTSSADKYLKAGARVEVEFPKGWESGWLIEARVADLHKDNEGRSFKHRYNVRHADGRELREIHPLCARVAS
jgi:hypothetical protein